MTGEKFVAPVREPFFGSVRVDDDLVTVTVAGEIDLCTVGRFRAVIATGVAANVPLMVVDVGGVEFAGLCVVSVLERAASQLALQGGRVLVCHAPPAVLRLFRAAELDNAVEVQGDAGVRASHRDDAADAEDVGAAPVDRTARDAALSLLVTIAQAVIPRADGVSITVPRQSGWGTVASSNAVVLQMDGDQYATGQGPCLDAARHGQRFKIEALGAEARWPAFVPRAQARGIECVLSTPLLTAGQCLGALNIYSRQADAFGASETEWADAFASEAAKLMSTTPTRPRDHTFADRIIDGLRTRETIAVGTGMLMQRDRVSSAEAVTVLHRESSAGHRSVRQICEDMVATQRDDGPTAHPDSEGSGTP